MRQKILIGILGFFLAASISPVQAKESASQMEKQMIEQRIENLQKKITDLRKRADEMESVESSDFVQTLEAAKVEAQEQLDNLRELGERSWESIKSGTEQTVDTIEKKYLSARRKFYEWRSQNEFEQLQADMKKLQQQADEAGQPVRGKFSKAANTFNDKADNLKDDLKQLQSESEENWQDAQDHLNQALKELQSNYDYLERKLFVWSKQHDLNQFQNQVAEYGKATSNKASEMKQKTKENLAAAQKEIKELKENLSDAMYDDSDNWQKFEQTVNNAYDKLKKSVNNLDKR